MAYDPIPFVDASGVAVWSAKVAGDSNNRAQITADGQMSWGPGNAAVDTFMSRSGVATVAFGEVDGAGAHTVLVYNTRSASGANYERLSLQYAAGTAYLREQQAGTGVARNLFIGTQGASTLRLITSNTGRWDIGATGHWTAVSDNAFDAGGTANRIRSIYWGTQALGPDGTVASPSYSFVNSTGTGLLRRVANVVTISIAGSDGYEFTSNSLQFGSAKYLGWVDTTTITAAGTVDVRLYRDAANSLALRNGVNAQLFSVYNTFTDASNQERLQFDFSSNIARILMNSSGTGSPRQLRIGNVGSAKVSLAVSNVDRWEVSTGHDLLPVANNAYDAGGPSNQIRNIYWGTQALASDGSAGAPSYSFSASGQQDVGMYRGSTDTIVFATAGTDRIRINNNDLIVQGVDLAFTNAAGGSTARINYVGTASLSTANWRPDQVNTRDLGSATAEWKSLYIATSILFGTDQSVTIAAGAASEIDITQSVVDAAASPIMITVTPAAHTGLTVGDYADVVLAFARTVEFTAGAAITNADGLKITPPTFAGTAGQVITDGSTVRITGAPGVGANMTYTNGPWALKVDAGAVDFGATLTVSTSVSVASASVLSDTNGITLGDAKNIIVNTTTGTRIGTGTTQKLGFWNATPVVQPVHIVDPTGGAVIDIECRAQLVLLLADQATLGLQAAS